MADTTGATWRATKVSASFANNVQVQAGILVNSFNLASPVEPADSAIICATSGDFSISATPETEDWFEDVNNAPNNTKEGLRINGWTCELTVNCLEITNDTLQLALGAADLDSGTGGDDGVHPRDQYASADFKTIYWLGDMVKEDKLLVVKMDNAVSTGGLQLSTTKNGKGQLSLTIGAYRSLSSYEDIPMSFYILTKAAAPTSP